MAPSRVIIGLVSSCGGQLGVAALRFFIPHNFKPMASLVEIANLALGEVSENNITSLDDETTPAQTAKRFIYQSIREVLAAGKWKCARESVVLAQSGTSPEFGWQYAYQLPADFIRVVRLNDIDADSVVNELFEVRGTRLETDESICKLVYIEDLTMSDGDVGSMPPMMVKACYLTLASKMAWKITQSRGLQATLEGKAEKALGRAKAIDAQQERRPLVNSAATSNWLRGRRTSTNG